MINIYVTNYNKPQFIPMQLAQLKKHCKNKFNLIIINNGVTPEMESEINQVCSSLKINSINFKKFANAPKYCSQSHTIALEYTLINYIFKADTEDITVIMDNDIFPFKDFDFVEMMNGKKVAGMYQQRVYDNVEHTYLSAIFTMFQNNVDMADFSFYNGYGDTGSGTTILMKKYETELIKHTAGIDMESEYIFRTATDVPYLEKYKCQFIHDCFIHYYRGSNWMESDSSYHENKLNFVKSFLENTEKYNILLDEFVCYEKAHSEKSYNGIDNNYKNYRFLEVNKKASN
jgi:hypothetical protein